MNDAIRKGVELGELVEKPPATLDTTPATTPVQPPATPPATGQQLAGTEQKPAEKPTETVPPAPGSLPAGSEQLQKLDIPANIQPVPVSTIDDLIRRGYTVRNDVCEILKHNFDGKAYRKEVTDRLNLYNNRLPPFNDIPPSSPPVNGQNMQVTGQQSAGNVLLTSNAARQNPENMGILPPVNTLQDGLPANSQQVTGEQTAGSGPPVTSQVPGGNPADTRREDTAPDSRQVTATLPPSTISSPTPQDMEMKITIPNDVPETPPVPVIDNLIRRGYRSRDDIEAIMKANFKGKAYRKDIQERIALFEARQPPFNDIAATPPSTPIILGADPANTRRESGGVSGGVPGENPQNTGNPLAPGSVPANVAATSAPDTINTAAESPPATELTEEQLISSLKSEYGVDLDVSCFINCL